MGKVGGKKLYVLHEYVCFTCSESERKVDSCRHLGWPCSLSRTVVGGGPDDPRNTRRERCLVYPPKRKMTRIGSVHGGDGPGSDTLSLLSCRVPSCACFTRVAQEASGRTRSFVACVVHRRPVTTRGFLFTYTKESEVSNPSGQVHFTRQQPTPRGPIS
jgi:hypothetical protein